MERNTVFEQKLKLKGFFNYPELYNFCFNWLRDERYNVDEEEYTEKIIPTGKEVVIKWKAWKKISDYFKYVIEMNWRIMHLQEAEIERDGKKEKTFKGEPEIRFKAFLEKDWESKWESSPFYKFLRGLYDKYVIRQTIDEYEDKLTDKCGSLVESIKGYLAMEGRK